MKVGLESVCLWVNINECVSSSFIPQGLILDDVLKSRPPATRPQFITLNKSQCLCLCVFVV